MDRKAGWMELENIQQKNDRRELWHVNLEYID